MNLELPSKINHKIFHGINFYAEGGRACYFYTHYFVLLQAARQHKFWNHKFYFAAPMKNHIVKWYFAWPNNDFLRYSRRFAKQPSLLGKIEKYINVTREAGVNNLKNINLPKASNIKLHKLFFSYFESYWKLMITAGLMRATDKGVMFDLRTELKNRANAEELLNIAAVPKKLSFALLEEISLLNLAIKIKNNDFSITSKQCDGFLNNIEKEFAWGVMGYYHEKPRNKNDYALLLKNILNQDPAKHLLEIKKRVAFEQKSRNGLVRFLNQDGKNLIKVASMAPYIKDLYKFSINKLEYFAEPLFTELSSRTGYSVEFIKDFHPTEILAVALNNHKKISAAKVEERVKQSLILAVPNKYAIYLGEEAQKFEDNYLAPKQNNTNEFKGRVACLGLAKGKVKVVLGPADFDKLKKGDILVVANTSPDFVPILRRAAAIVAEDGGITAHVSLVSREFGIPCVVGIPHITAMLKDGDLVEVDANKGIVRKI